MVIYLYLNFYISFIVQAQDMENENLILSICIPTYNGMPNILKSLKYIEKAFSPYNDHIEVCISDNGSNDGSKEFLNKISSNLKPNINILEKIKNLPFDYYQLYDCTPEEIKEIKEKYQKKIITAFTIKSKSDLSNYKLYSDHTDIYLFDSKGYEKSQSFDHDLIKNIKLNKELMIAGNIQYNEELKNFKNLANFIDLSGGVETSGLKDLSKIEFFLNKVNEIKNET